MEKKVKPTDRPGLIDFYRDSGVNKRHRQERLIRDLWIGGASLITAISSGYLGYLIGQAQNCTK
ncbi:MAG: hypothetical protein AAB437_02950 [Patescibacteria group bacterium]